MNKLLAYIALYLISTLFLKAQEKTTLTNDIKFIGSADMITYFDGRDFSNKTYAENFTSMKLRFGAEKWLGDDVGFVVIFQDSRVWGMEDKLTANSKNLDLCRGYLQLKNLFNQPLSFLIGRYQMEYGTGMVIGYSNWNYVERAFDGAVAKYESEKFSADVYYALHTASINSQKRDALPSVYNYPASDYNGYNIIGFWTDTKIFDGQKISIYGVNERNSKKSDSTNIDLDRNTVGVAYFVTFKDLAINCEFNYQFGKIAKKDLSAYGAIINFDYNISPFKLSVGNETYSGSSPDIDVLKSNSFDNYLGAKHRFLGLMDYFSNLKTGTSDLGVHNINIKAAFQKKGSPLNISLAGSYFLSNQDSKDGENAFGQEIDISFKYNIMKNVSVESCSGAFVPGKLFKEMWQYKDKSGNIFDRDDVAFMSYIRFRLAF